MAAGQASPAAFSSQRRDPRPAMNGPAARVLRGTRTAWEGRGRILFTVKNVRPPQKFGRAWSITVVLITPEGSDFTYRQPRCRVARPAPSRNRVRVASDYDGRTAACPASDVPIGRLLARPSVDNIEIR
jgi:hypothetical protein